MRIPRSVARALRSARWVAAALAILLGASDPARGEPEEEAPDLVPPVALDATLYDPDNAADIQEICAGCHGVFGEGGGDGTYPRLAGMSADYLADQLRAFKSRERVNIPMAPYATERELPEEDIRDITIFLSRIELLSAMPDLPEDTGGYERLMIAKRVFNVAAVDGDVSRGRALFETSCRRCHGEDGLGRRKTPPLAGQYTVYLRRQIDLFLGGKRSHRNVDKYFRRLESDDLDNLFAFLAAVDD